jgi:adenylate cyclase
MRFRLKLQGKAILITIGLLFMAMSVATAVSVVRFRNDYLDVVVARSEALGRGLRAEVESFMSLGLTIEQLEGMNEILKRDVAENENVGYFGIMSLDGKALYHSDSGLVGRVFSDPVAQKSAASQTPLTQYYRRTIDGKDYYDTTIPLFDVDGDHIAAIRVGFPADVVNRKLFGLVLNSVIVMVVSFLVASGLLVLFISGGITNPIKRLVTGAEEIGHGNYNYKIEVRSADEIGYLGESFNTMSGNLKTSQESLVRRIAELNSLNEVGRVINSTLNLSEALNFILKKALEFSRASSGFLALFSGDRLELSVAINVKIKDVEKKVSLSTDEKFIGWMLKELGRPFLVSEKKNHLPLREFLTRNIKEMSSLNPTLFVPLVGKGGLVGMMAFGEKSSKRDYAQDEINLLRTFAHQASVAIENAKLYEDVVEARNREVRIRNIFQRYVPKEVVDEVLRRKDDSMLVGEERRVTVLISDIRGYTSITERLKPEQVVWMLNEYFAEMVEIVFKHGGIVDKFMGDSIMAFFGAPISYGDDARRAVSVGLEMIDKLNEINRRRKDRGEEEIKIGIGISTGFVVAGNIGSNKKMEYTIIGDDVNLASRIENLTRSYPNGILISQNTYNQVKDLVDVDKLEPVMVKGKSAPIQIYWVKGRAGS